MTLLKDLGENEKYKQDVWRPLDFVSGEPDTWNIFPSKYRLTRCEVRENQYHKLPLISPGLMQLRKEFYEGLYPRGL